jgi:hypothetical protein
MNKVTGEVSAIGSKPVNTKWGEKSTHSFQVDGVWYKTGFKKGKFSKGDTITFTYVEGPYGNDVDVASISTGGGATTASAPAASAAKPAYTGGGKGVFPIPALDGQRAIVRQNALTNARELWIAHGSKGDNIKDEAYDIIAIARVFEAYACGDLDAMKAAEMKAAKSMPTIEEVTE